MRSTIVLCTVNDALFCSGAFGGSELAGCSWDLEAGRDSFNCNGFDIVGGGELSDLEGAGGFVRSMAKGGFFKLTIVEVLLN